MENILGILMLGIPLTVFGGIILFIISEVRDNKKRRKKHV